MKVISQFLLISIILFSNIEKQTEFMNQPNHVKLITKS